jgi:hypothetical protein
MAEIPSLDSSPASSSARGFVSGTKRPLETLLQAAGSISAFPTRPLPDLASLTAASAYLERQATTVDDAAPLYRQQNGLPGPISGDNNWWWSSGASTSALWVQRMLCGPPPQPQQPPVPLNRLPPLKPPPPPPQTSLAHHNYYYPSPLPCPALLYNHRAAAATLEANHAPTVMEQPVAYHAAELASLEAAGWQRYWEFYSRGAASEDTTTVLLPPPPPPLLHHTATAHTVPDGTTMHNTERPLVGAASHGPKVVPRETREETSTTNFTGKKPKRALSAYNLFFQAERQRLLDEHEASTETGYGGRRRQRGRPKQSPPRPLPEGRKKLGFEDLAKVIAQRWKDLDPDSSEMQTYLQLAAEEKKRYQAEKKVWDKQKEVALTKQWQELEKSVGEQTRKEYLDQVISGSKKRKASL